MRPFWPFIICNHIPQKMKFSINNFFSKCDQTERKLRIWSYLLNKSLMENCIFCAVSIVSPSSKKYFRNWNVAMIYCFNFKSSGVTLYENLPGIYDLSDLFFFFFLVSSMIASFDTAFCIFCNLKVK